MLSVSRGCRNCLVVRYANRNSRRVYIRQYTIGRTYSMGEFYTREHLLTCSPNHRNFLHLEKSDNKRVNAFSICLRNALRGVRYLFIAHTFAMPAFLRCRWQRSYCSILLSSSINFSICGRRIGRSFSITFHTLPGEIM